jgi:hypothetical protein
MSTSPLPELLAVKLDLWETRVALATAHATIADREARLRSLELTADQAALLAACREVCGASPDAVWQPETRTFQEPT